MTFEENTSAKPLTNVYDFGAIGYMLKQEISISTDFRSSLYTYFNKQPKGKDTDVHREGLITQS